MKVCIGIFWVYKNSILPLSIPVKQRLEEGRFVNGPYNHATSWPIIQQKYYGAYPELFEYEYDEIPRGRILYDQQKHIVLCYIDEAVLTTAVKQSLAQIFYLQEVAVHCQSDFHYTTNPDELDKLFKG